MTFDGRIEAQLTVPASTTIAVTNGAGGPTTVTIAAGTYYMTSLLAQVQSALIAQRAPSTGTWVVSLSTGPSGTGQVTINCTQASGTWSITWTSTTLRDVLGFTANIVAVSTAQTGTKQARALWLPDCPLALDGDPGRSPLVTDLRATISPGGAVYAMVGNSFLRHSHLLYGAVPRAKVWETQAALANASWETFCKDTQLGQGSITWFAVMSLVQVYDHSGIQLGIDANAGAGVTGWSMPDITGVEPKKRPGQQWVGLWQIEIPRLVSAG